LLFGFQKGESSASGERASRVNITDAIQGQTKTNGPCALCNQLVHRLTHPAQKEARRAGLKPENEIESDANPNYFFRERHEGGCGWKAGLLAFKQGPLRRFQEMLYWHCWRSLHRIDPAFESVGTNGAKWARLSEQPTRH
jgi:hypothetical protein